MFKPKDQIVYIPRHAKGDINHPDVEYGFVFSTITLSCFCRFWLKDLPGVLRTTSCSENVRKVDLRKHNSCTEGEVNIVYEGIKATYEKT